MKHLSPCPFAGLLGQAPAVRLLSNFVMWIRTVPIGSACSRVEPSWKFACLLADWLAGSLAGSLSKTCNSGGNS